MHETGAWNLLVLRPHFFHPPPPNTHTHAHAGPWTFVITASKAVRSSAQAILLYFCRPITFTQLNELSNLTITQPLHYQGISILQHLILPVHSSPTPLMQAPGPAHRNWIAEGIRLQQMQWSSEVKRVCVCECAWGSSTLCGPCFFFLLQLIRAANNSLLRFHLSSKPLEARSGSQWFRGGSTRCQAQHTTAESGAKTNRTALTLMNKLLHRLTL